VAELHPALILLAGALLLPLFPPRLRGTLFLVFPLGALAVVWALPVGTTLEIPFLGYELVVLRVTQLARVFAIIFALIGFLAGLYAHHVDDAGQQVAALLYGAGSLTVTFAGDWLTLFVGWEVMAVASTFLIWARRTRQSDGAGMRYLIAHLAGGSLLLAGIILQVHGTGSLAVTGFAPGESAAAWLILAGVLLNTATPPLHAWLPDAYPKATVTGAVFLSALTTKTAVYLLAALFPGWRILVVLGVTMALYGVVYAVIVNDIREILAYHIISQVGYMVTGVGIGTELGINGTTAHAFSHILYKALLFMGAGAVLHTTGKSTLHELGGLGRHQPAVFWLYMVGAFSIGSFPLFNGFTSKVIVVEAAGDAGLYAAKLLLILAAVGTFLSTGLKLPYWTWYGKDRGLTPTKAPGTMIAAMGITGFLCFLLGVAPRLLYRELPFPIDYQPYNLPHLVEITQALLFTFLAFWIFRHKLAGKPTTALDLDWLYRRPAPVYRRLFVTSVDGFFDRCEAAVQRAARELARLAIHPIEALRSLSAPGQPFDPDGDRSPLGHALTWTLLTVLGVALLSLWR
jgi:multicomponent Na+:H+ antiporter subunit D